MTGLSGSGKTTLCRAATAFLRPRGHQVQTLDGDELRKGISADLGFSIADRMENIRRAAELARRRSANKTTGGGAMICPTEDMRSLVRSVLPDVIEVFFTAPLVVCETRDPAVSVVGPLPQDLHAWLDGDVAISSRTADAKAAGDFLAYITRAAATPVWKAKGLDRS